MKMPPAVLQISINKLAHFDEVEPQ